MPRTRHAISWSPLALAIFGALAGCGGPESPAIAADSGVGGDDVVTVPVVRPERAELEVSTTQPATVHPDYQAEIHAKVSGYLSELKADIGDRVEAGQVLGVIDVPELDRGRERQQATIARLEADERRAAAEVELAGADVEAAAAMLDQEQADIASARAALDAQRAEFDRVQGLVSEGAVTGQLLDEATERLESAEASLGSADAASATARANVDVANAKLAASRARRETSLAETEVARKELGELDAMLSYAILTSPFDGTVIRRNVDPGDLVRNIQGASGGLPEPLFVVAKLDTVRVRVPLPEDDSPVADVGDPARVAFRSTRGGPIEGRVSRISRGLDPSTRTMLVEVDLPNPDLALLPGMFGEATVILERAEGLVLPAGSVRFDEKGRGHVYVIGDGEVIRVVDVTTGLDDGNRIQIVSGLDGSERVVAPTIDRLAEGQRVRIADE
ncbi:efflux RND transporter periplasmic adaptor subunit [Tautonia plasticadhaerens]|uniref:Multidrug resistance protein MdtA n=1 Tax=Tautonia plasticadhaerens TaxID=2527974 RepID=A0A518H704_9BACT|nr:efflux RND transporter periplasmic adaptor subunit [Tautonia plasticadhaerens]QDV36592.1 Multidrug resistance protein MdtA precursor [Tautonia plasticadhaerens]